LTQKSQVEGVAPTDDQPKPAESEKGPLKLKDTVDPLIFEKLLENPDAGAQGALGYMMEQFQTVLDDRDKHHAAAMQEALKPYREGTEQAEQFGSMVEKMTSVGSKVDKDGNQLYPELIHDQSFVEAVGTRVLNTPGLEEAGEMGVYLALLAEREWRRMQGVTSDTGIEPEGDEDEDEGEEEELSPSEALELNAQEAEEARGADVIADDTSTRLPSKARTEEDILRSKISRELIDHEERIDPDIGFDL
jgi:hypothetical protein